MCIRDSLIYLFIADNVSPPPAIENAEEFAIAIERSLVPFENNLFSNTPIGPFHKMVLA